MISFILARAARWGVIALGALVCTIAMIGLVIGPHYYLPFSLDIALVAQVFVFVGMALRFRASYHCLALGYWLRLALSCTSIALLRSFING
jgi:hypothetical protein